MDYDALRQANSAGWLIDEPVLLGKLDLLLKRNTAFIKRLRMVLAETKDAILAELAAVLLAKYTLELSTLLVEGIARISKRDDVLATVMVALELHQRFGLLVTPAINLGVLGLLKDPELTPKQLAVVVELIAELQRVGLFETLGHADRASLPSDYAKRYLKLERQPMVVVVLKDLLLQRFLLGDMLPVVQRMVKRYGPDFPDLEMAVPVVEVYYEAVAKQVKTLQKQVHILDANNRKAAVRVGRFLPEHTEPLEEAQQQLAKFHAAADVVATVMGYDKPAPLSELEASVDPRAPQVEVVKAKPDEELVFESSAQRAFYTEIPTMELLEAQEIEVLDVYTWVTKFERAAASEEQLAFSLARGGFNNKATHQKILRRLLDLKSTALPEFFSKWSRFLAIARVEAKAVIDDLVLQLDNEFKHHVKLEHMYLFLELIKFHLVPSHIIFHKIRTLTLHLDAGANLDLLVMIYENCGRFLYYDPEFGADMKRMVELLKDCQRKSSLSVNKKMAVRLLVQIVEPVRGVKPLQRQEGPQWTPKQLFVARLLGSQLCVENMPEIFAVFKFTDVVFDADIQPVFLYLFSHPELVNYDALGLLARIFKYVVARQRAILVRVIDDILELVKRGLELNDYRLNRVRMAQAKFLAECFNHQLVSLKLIVSVCYKIITLGHPNNQPLPHADVALDMPDNFFRVLLVCTILLALRAPPSLWKSSARQLVTTLLVFTQYYIFCKAPLPVETRFKVDELLITYGETVGLQPLNLIGEAARALQLIVAEQGSLQNEADEVEEAWGNQEVAPADDELDDAAVDDDGLDDDDDDLDDDLDDNDDDNDDLNDDIRDDDDSDSELLLDSVDLDGDDDGDDDASDTQSQLDKRMAAEIDREISRIVHDLCDTSKRLPPRKVQLEVPVLSGGANFKLMSRRGKLTQVHQLKNMPVDNKFAELVQRNRQDQAAYRQRILQLAHDMAD